jgi:hypothetical protein
MNLKKDSLRACAAELQALGFVKSKGEFLKRYSPSLDGWLGLNLAERNLPDALAINPVVGVRHVALNSILDRLRDDVPVGPKPVVCSPLGYLMPENSFREWEFTSRGDCVSIAKSMSSAVEAFGIPYIERLGDWDFFCRKIEEPGFLLEHEANKVLPVVHAINGDRNRAKSLVDAELVKLLSREDVYAISYRSFSQRFLQALDSL